MVQRKIVRGSSVALKKRKSRGGYRGRQFGQWSRW